MHILRLSMCLCEFQLCIIFSYGKKNYVVYTFSSRKVGEELNVQQRELKQSSRSDQNVKAVNCASRKIHVTEIFVDREEQRVRSKAKLAGV